LVALIVAVVIGIAVSPALFYDRRGKRHGWKAGVSGQELQRWLDSRPTESTDGPDELPAPEP